MSNDNQQYYYVGDDSKTTFGPGEMWQLFSLYKQGKINDDTTIINEKGDFIEIAEEMMMDFKDDGRSCEILPQIVLPAFVKKMEIKQTLLRLTHKSRHSSTVVMMPRDDKSEENLTRLIERLKKLNGTITVEESKTWIEKFCQFSGVLVQIKDRLFIATVAHGIEDTYSKYISLSGRGIDFIKDKGLSILKKGFKDKDKIDIGFIELEKDEYLNKYPDKKPIKKPITLEDIQIDGMGKQNSFYFLIGAPSQHTSLDSFKIDHSIHVVWRNDILTYVTCPSTKKDTKKYPSYDRNIDIILCLDANYEVLCKTGENRRFDNPEGMSGGGLWKSGFQVLQGNTLSTPYSKLVGIQCGWLTKSKLMRSVQIIHWLRLIYEHYPDLRPEINLVENFTIE